MTWKQKTKPALYEAPMKRVNVRLDTETVEKAKQLGRGNLSAGLRNAVAIAIALHTSQASQVNPDAQA